MKSFKDLTDLEFGDWKVISLSDKKVQGKLYWKCKCICGQIRDVCGHSLKKYSRSCGCVTYKKNRKANCAVIQKMAYYRRDASLKKLVFNLTEDQFLSVAQNNCYYCNESPRLWSQYLDIDGNVRSRFKNKMDEDYLKSTAIKINGLDRIDNSIGYVKGNIVACCRTCNFMKGTKTVKEFLKKIQEIYNFKALEDNTFVKAG